jgi:cytidine deaminase
LGFGRGLASGDVGVKTFNIEGSIKIKSELAPCGSCTNVIKSFSSLFPKIKIEIIAQPKVSF